MPGQLSTLADSGLQQAAAAGDAPSIAAANAAAAAATQGLAGGYFSAVPSSVPSSVDVAASQMLSVSMLSDIQLPSSPSSMSVAESIIMQSRISVDNLSG